MSNSRRSIASLRAEKEARERNVREGIKLRNVIAQVLSGPTPVSKEDLPYKGLLEKAIHACALLEHATYFDRAAALHCKGKLEREHGRIMEALASLREARQLYTLALAAGQVHERDVPEVTDASMMVLCDIAWLLQSSNQYVESEKCLLEVLSTPGLRIPPG